MAASDYNVNVGSIGDATAGLQDSLASASELMLSMDLLDADKQTKKKDEAVLKGYSKNAAGRARAKALGDAGYLGRGNSGSVDKYAGWVTEAVGSDKALQTAIGKAEGLKGADLTSFNLKDAMGKNPDLKAKYASTIRDKVLTSSRMEELNNPYKDYIVDKGTATAVAYKDLLDAGMSPATAKLEAAALSDSYADKKTILANARYAITQSNEQTQLNYTNRMEQGKIALEANQHEIDAYAASAALLAKAHKPLSPTQRVALRKLTAGNGDRTAEKDYDAMQRDPLGTIGVTPESLAKGQRWYTSEASQDDLKGQVQNLLALAKANGTPPALVPAMIKSALEDGVEIDGAGNREYQPSYAITGADITENFKDLLKTVGNAPYPGTYTTDTAAEEHTPEALRKALAALGPAPTAIPLKSLFLTTPHLLKGPVSAEAAIRDQFLAGTSYVAPSSAHSPSSVAANPQARPQTKAPVVPRPITQPKPVLAEPTQPKPAFEALRQGIQPLTIDKVKQLIDARKVAQGSQRFGVGAKEGPRVTDADTLGEQVGDVLTYLSPRQRKQAWNTFDPQMAVQLDNKLGNYLELGPGTARQPVGAPKETPTEKELRALLAAKANPKFFTTPTDVLDTREKRLRAKVAKEATKQGGRVHPELDFSRASTGYKPLMQANNDAAYVPADTQGTAGFTGDSSAALGLIGSPMVDETSKQELRDMLKYRPAQYKQVVDKINAQQKRLSLANSRLGSFLNPVSSSVNSTNFKPSMKPRSYGRLPTTPPATLPRFMGDSNEAERLMDSSWLANADKQELADMLKHRPDAYEETVAKYAEKETMLIEVGQLLDNNAATVKAKREARKKLEALRRLYSGS